MSHLDSESLARLVDDEATSLEAAHLADCDACRAELEVMRDNTQALGRLGDITPPEHAWTDLSERLEAEGLVRRSRHRATPVLWRLAAALALFLTGTLAGFSWRTATLPEPAGTFATSDDAGTRAQQPQDGLPQDGLMDGAVDAAEATDDAAARDALPAPVATRADDPAAIRSDAADAGVSPIERAPSQVATADPSNDERPQPRITGPAPADPRFAALPQFATPRTAQEAAVLLRDAEGMYLSALVSYSQLAGDADETGDPMARLAALEGIVLSTRAALDRAPADPIINGYHMTALAQREATLRQIAATTSNPWF